MGFSSVGLHCVFVPTDVSFCNCVSYCIIAVVSYCGSLGSWVPCLSGR